MVSKSRARLPGVAVCRKDREAFPFRSRGHRTSRGIPVGAAGCDDGLENFGVAGAAAKVSRKAFADFGFGGLRVARQKINGGENHSWRADSALRATMRQKSL